jgi:acyl-CoA reductase-like NAD-dependent aldehyde dehydrogenase
VTIVPPRLAVEETARPELDRLVERLAGRAEPWSRVGIPERIDYIDRCVAALLEVAPEWVAEACRRRGLDPDSAIAGEEWLSGPMVTVAGLRRYADALKQGGQPRPPRAWTRPDGQQAFGVFPIRFVDRVLFSNMSAELWIEPGLPPSQGKIYREKARGAPSAGGLALVLGAGNISSIAPLDVAHKLFVEDQVALLKMNPVNGYLGPFLEYAFEPLIRDGFLAVVQGGAETGDHLCRHSRMDTIHLTGSVATHDAIVWGADPDERRRRRAKNRPRIDKPVTSELGCVTPVLVVPGRWSASDLEFQARHVAGMVAHNASFNCTAGQLLVLARDWPQREAFLDRLRNALASTPSRRAYYPGALDRYSRFVEHYPRAAALSPGGPEVVPWTLIPDLDPDSEPLALTEEAFCGLLAEVPLEAAGQPGRFLERAVSFLNDRVRGTLSCVLLIDRATRRANADALERALAELRYGNIGVNAWTGVNYSLPGVAWGAFPEPPGEEAFSGRGFVHNAFLFDHPQKSIVRAPFRMWPKPVWFAGHRTLDRVGRHLTDFEARRSPKSLAAVLLAGVGA